MNNADDLIEALGPIIDTFQILQIPHYVGGSIASSFHGATRSTMDVDLICEMKKSQIANFLVRIDERYYVSEVAVRQAVQRMSCFNLIHLPTSFKVDIFVSRQRPFDNDCMRRASMATLGESKTIKVPIATAEDAIISKLEWYRLTNETSERQWDDVSRLIQLLGDAADFSYLRDAAQSVGVTDLLDRLINN